MTPEEIEALMRKESEDVVVRYFEASYESECPCGEPIFPGDKAGYIGNDDQASCWDCVEDARKS